MTGITAEALRWSLQQLKSWTEGDAPGIRFKQVIYRLLLLRELGVTDTKTIHLSTADFRKHCRRFLLVSNSALAAKTGGKEHYFIPTTGEYQKARGEGSTDWAIGTMWTRLDTWEKNGIIEFETVAGTQGERAIRFSDTYASTLHEQLGSTQLPALPLAIFLLRDPVESGLSLPRSPTQKGIIDQFLKVFNLDTPELKALFDLTTGDAPRTLAQVTSLSAGKMLEIILEVFPFRAGLADDSAGGSVQENKYAIPKGELKGISDKPVQVLVHGCPGSGKSYLLQDWAKQLSRSITTVFHPETSYADFVGVYRPQPIFRTSSTDIFVDEEGRPRPSGEPYITYEFVPGPFLDAYCLAKRNPGESVVLIIEELSRANASLVFGDMLQLLDRLDSDVANGRAGESVYQISPKPEVAAYLRNHGIDAETDGKMRLPRNFHIWVTMNRSDQNARQLDSAFLRRWDKKYMSYATKSSYGDDKVKVPGGTIGWDELRTRINEQLIALAPEDKFIGPYFLRQKRLSNPESVAEDLLGYLWNDVLKARARDFFSKETFAEARDAWISGTSNPLKNITLP